MMIDLHRHHLMPTGSDIRVASFWRELLDYAETYKLGRRLVVAFRRAVALCAGEEVESETGVDVIVERLYELDGRHQRLKLASDVPLSSGISQLVAYCDEYGARGADVLAALRLAVERVEHPPEEASQWQEVSAAEARRRVLERTAHLRTLGPTKKGPIARSRASGPASRGSTDTATASEE